MQGSQFNISKETCTPFSKLKIVEVEMSKMNPVTAAEVTSIRPLILLNTEPSPLTVCSGNWSAATGDSLRRIC